MLPFANGMMIKQLDTCMAVWQKYQKKNFFL